MSFREVGFLALDSVERWREYSIAGTGLSDTPRSKFTALSVGSGYSYEVLSPETRHRFVIWRATGETLELLELSLDHDLCDNALRIHLPYPVVPDVVFIEKVDHQEASFHVIVATKRTFHRFVFEHPSSMKDTPAGEHVSIFANVTAGDLQAGSCNLDTITKATPNIVSKVDNSCAALGCSNGTLVALLLQEAFEDDGVRYDLTALELKQGTMMQRLWGGLLSGQRDVDAENAIVSLSSHTLDGLNYIFALCLDKKLRVWSLSRRTCIKEKEIEWDTWDNASDNQVKRLQLRVYGCKNDPTQIKLIFYLGLEGESQFQVYEGSFLEGKEGEILLDIIPSVHFFKEDGLVDFRVCNDKLWSLWRQNEDEAPVQGTLGTCLRYSLFRMSNDEDDGQDVTHAIENNQWQSAILHDPTTITDQVSPYALNYDEAFLEQIFQKGRFSSNCLMSALQMFRGVPLSQSQQTLIMGAALDRLQIKKDICSVIHEEIAAARAALAGRAMGSADSELNETDLQELSFSLWSRFVSCCVKCWREENRPLGMHAHPHTDLLCLVKKGGISFLRPCDTFEALTASAVASRRSVAFDIIEPTRPLDSDVWQLLSSIRFVGEQVGECAFHAFEEDLFTFVEPADAALHLVSNLIGGMGDSEFTPGTATTGPVPKRRFVLDFLRSFHSIRPKPLEAIDKLLALLGQVGFSSVDPQERHPIAQQWITSLFASSISRSIIGEGFYQLVRSRFVILRNLLVSLLLLIRLRSESGLSSDARAKLQTRAIPSALLLLKGYFLMGWIASRSVQPLPTNASVKEDLPDFTSLDLSGHHNRTSKLASKQTTLAELYYSDFAGSIQETLAHSYVTNGYLYSLSGASPSVPAPWRVLHAFVSELVLRLWCPDVSKNVTFATLLDRHHQYDHVQEFVRLSEKSGVSSGLEGQQENRRKLLYLLGKSYLNTGQFDKASDCFHKASLRSSGVLADDQWQGIGGALSERLEDQSDFEVEYLMHIMHLFASFRQNQHAISFAFAALGVSESSKNKLALPQLWSNVFKFSMELGDYEQAYLALNSNPDDIRKMDCLKRFVVVLCGSPSGLQLLCALPFVDMVEDVVAILHQKAQTFDLNESPNYYQILYSFHINRGDYRQAAQAMYEYAERLRAEGHTGALDGLQKLVNSYLACLNALRLVDERFAWVDKREIRPLFAPGRATSKRKRDGNSFDDDSYGSSSASTERSQQDAHSFIDSHMVGIQAIERQYSLALAHLELGKKSASHLDSLGSPSISPFDTYTYLVQTGLFDRAISIARLFDFSLRSVFEALTKRCLALQTRKVAPTLSSAQLNEYKPADSSSGSCWKMVEEYLNTYDSVDNNYEYYQCVATVILSTDSRMKLPPWLISGYKVRNAPALLDIYIKYELLEEAAELALDLLHPDRKNGTQQTKRASKGATTRSIPYTRTEQLLLQLQTVLSAESAKKLSSAHQKKLSDMKAELEKELYLHVRHVEDASHVLLSSVS